MIEGTAVTDSYTIDFYEGQQEGSFRSACEVVPLVLERLTVRSVVDVGCGVGTWLKAFSSHGVEETWGIDGEWVEDSMLQIPREKFLARDLTDFHEIGRTFDLVVSLEVAEHLPSEAAAGFVRSLVALGPVVLFSAAAPFDGGVHHVNEQWPDYWAELFLHHGYVPIDILRKRIWQNERVQWWYRQNILIFVRQECLSDYPMLEGEYQKSELASLALVHPESYLQKVQELTRLRELRPGAISLRKVLHALPGIVGNTVKQRVKRLFMKMPEHQHHYT